MFGKKTVRDIDVTGKRVLVRVDFNVPVKDGEVADDTRIQAALPTLQYLLEQGASVVICSHLGRPKGEADPSLSLRPVSKRLASLVGQPVGFIGSTVGPEVEKAASDLQPGDILLLENTRFQPGEKSNEQGFAEELAKLGEVFVNDAFGSAHRAHASTVGVAHLLPAVAGFLMEKELKYLGEALEDPSRPFVAILGGAKISDKIGVVDSLLGKVDRLLIGGGMANTFLAAQGMDMQESLVEADSLDTAATLIDKAGDTIQLPTDLKVGDEFSEGARSQVVPVGSIPQGWHAMDIGPDTVQAFKGAIAGAGTVVWNGPMGVFEFPNFAQGTVQIAQALAASSALSIVGGGDSAAAIAQAGLIDQIDHVSTGGGASLEMLEGKLLPGVEALMDA